MVTFSIRNFLWFRSFLNTTWKWKLAWFCEIPRLYVENRNMKFIPRFILCCTLIFFLLDLIFTIDYISFFTFSLNKSFICFLCSLIHHNSSSRICCFNTKSRLFYLENPARIFFIIFPSRRHTRQTWEIPNSPISAPKSCFMIFLWNTQYNG